MGNDDLTASTTSDEFQNKPEQKIVTTRTIPVTPPTFHEAEIPTSASASTIPGIDSNRAGDNDRKKIQQDLVSDLLSTLDNYAGRLTTAERNKAVNAFNAAVALKHISD